MKLSTNAELRLVENYIPHVQLLARPEGLFLKYLIDWEGPFTFAEAELRVRTVTDNAIARRHEILQEHEAREQAAWKRGAKAYTPDVATLELDISI